MVNFTKDISSILVYDQILLIDETGHSYLWRLDNARSLVPNFPESLPTLTRLKGSYMHHWIRRAEEVTKELLDIEGVSVELGVYQGKDVSYSVAEFIEGSTFTDSLLPPRRSLRFWQRRQYPVLDRVKCTRDVARVLEQVHAKGFVHRDVKPDNIIIDFKGDTHLIDWGISYFVGEKEIIFVSPNSGSRAYMPPEAITAYESGRFVDIYALGCVLFYALVGRAAFHNRDNCLSVEEKQDLHPILRRIKLGNQDLDFAARVTVAKFLDPFPERRVQTMSEAVQEITSLEELLGEN